MYRKLKAPWNPPLMGPSDTSLFEDFAEEQIDDHAKRFATGTCYCLFLLSYILCHLKYCRDFDVGVRVERY